MAIAEAYSRLIGNVHLWLNAAIKKKPLHMGFNAL